MAKRTTDDRQAARAALSALRRAVGYQREALTALEAAQTALLTLVGRAGVGGRPSVRDRPGVREGWAEVRRRLLEGELSRRQAARELGISAATVVRLLRESA